MFLFSGVSLAINTTITTTYYYQYCTINTTKSFFFFFILRGIGQKKASAHRTYFHVFSYGSCVDSAQLLSQPNASWRVLRIPL